MAETRNEIDPLNPRAVRTGDDETLDQDRFTTAGLSTEDDTFDPQYSSYDEDDDTGNKRSASDIERDIEQTRAQMSEKIDEIQERFSPQHITSEFTHHIKETARGAGYSMMETIKENPLPAAIAGLSLAWLFMKGRNNTSSYDRSYGRSDWNRRRGYYEGPGYSSRPMYGDAGSYGYYNEYGDRNMGSEHSMTDSAREMAGHAGERVKDFAHDVQDNVRDLGHRVENRFEDLGHTVQHQAYRVRGSVERMMDESPLAVGAIALGIGAAIGLMLPKTQMENELVGEKSDQFVQTAKDKAEDTFEKVQHVAERTFQEVKNEAKDSAQRIKNTARDEAQRQGLSGTGAPA